MLLADAKAKGYTEPDPAADLSGTDVARKLLILARKACASLLAVGPENSLYHLRGTDNCAIFTTEDYPAGLVIQGAGAGARQTAGGVLMDIIA